MKLEGLTTLNKELKVQREFHENWLPRSAVPAFPTDNHTDRRSGEHWK